MASGKGPLRIAIEDFLEFGPLGKVIKGGIKSWLEEREQELIVANRELLSMLLSDPNMPPEIRAVLERNFSGSHQVSAAAIIMTIIGAVLGLVMGAMGPVARSGEYIIDKKMQTARMQPSEAFMAGWRSPQHEQRILGGLRELGWSVDDILAWQELLKPRVAESDLLRLYHRYPTFRGSVRDELRKRGWEDENIELLVKASQQTPGLQDLVTMAVREVFDPGQRAALGLDAEFPEAFGIRAELIGVDPEFARDYWAAHWQLPSLQMGFDMLHRLRPGRFGNPVTLDTIDALIKAHDISPVWRDRLRAISYTPLTRVDIRRVYAMGGMSKTDVYEAYLDLGYEPVNAQRLSDFATLESGTSGKDLTRSAIQSAYGKGMITYEIALEELIDLGYDSSEAAFWLSYEDYTRQEKLEKLQLDVIEDKFIEGEIDIVSAQAQLTELHLSGAYVETLLEEWRIKKEKAVKYPTKAELEDLYENHIIDYDTMLGYMLKRGYQPQVAQWLVVLIDIRVQQKAQTELERAQKEADRLAEKADTTDYQLERSRLDANIADWNAYIAELKLALHSVDTTEQEGLVKEEIDRTKLIIANLGIEKANLKTQFLEESQPEE
jgi:hypothetical protein